MPKPPHVEQDKIDDATVTALAASTQDVDTGQIDKATETLEAAVAEMRYFREPANAANIGRLEALGYAWRKEFVFRNVVRLIGMVCTFMALVELMGQPWPLGIPRAMQMMGFSGIYPALFGAVWLCGPRSNSGRFLAYQFRAAPILLVVGAGLIAIGLFGAWLT